MRLKDVVEFPGTRFTMKCTNSSLASAKYLVIEPDGPWYQIVHMKTGKLHKYHKSALVVPEQECVILDD